MAGSTWLLIVEVCLSIKILTPVTESVTDFNSFILLFARSNPSSIFFSAKALANKPVKNASIVGAAVIIILRVGTNWLAISVTSFSLEKLSSILDTLPLICCSWLILVSTFCKIKLVLDFN